MSVPSGSVRLRTVAHETRTALSTARPLSSARHSSSVRSATSGETAANRSAPRKAAAGGGVARTTNSVARATTAESARATVVTARKSAAVTDNPTAAVVKKPVSAPKRKSLARLVAATDRSAAGSGSADSCQLTVGTANDHTSIHHLFRNIELPGARDGFLASLDDPFYEPHDRLLVRRGPQVLAHVHLLRRSMRWGDIDLPVAGLTGLVTTPELRRQGLARKLVTAADRTMRRDGAVVALTTTRLPQFMHSAGWAVCGRHVYSRVSIRGLLAGLSAQRSTAAAATPALGEASVAGGAIASDERPLLRPWRQVELPGLMRCYAAAHASTWGPYQRTEAYWRWLVSRQEFDRIFVALDPARRSAWDDFDSPIIGYVVVKEDRIVELVAPPAMSQAMANINRAVVAAQHQALVNDLLSRACGEALERDYQSIEIHAAPNDPLHDLFRSAGGNMFQHEALQGDYLMAKVLDPVGLVRRLAPLLVERARSAGLPANVDFGLLIDDERSADAKLHLAITRRGVKVERRRLGRSYLRLRAAELTRLLLGHGEVSEAVAQGRISASTRLAETTAAALFPRVSYWRAPWDELRY